MRPLTATSVAALTSATVKFVVFVELFLSETVRINSSPVLITWNGVDWLGAGQMGTIEEIKDANAEHAPLKFTLSGGPADAIALALGEPVRNKRVNVRLGILNATTEAVIEAPIMWTGLLANMPIEQKPGAENQPATCTLSVTAAHMGEVMQRLKPVRYTDIDQQRLYPGDTCCRFVVSQSQHPDIWPAASYFRR